jgi:hypothetical protein
MLDAHEECSHSLLYPGSCADVFVMKAKPRFDIMKRKGREATKVNSSVKISQLNKTRK